MGYYMMTTKKTKQVLLSRIDLAIIEEIIAHCGSLTDFNCIYKALAHEYSKAEVANKIVRLKKAGWLVAVKQGIYAITNIGSHNFTNISPLVISRVFVPNSYVSFEFALNYHGLFDQLPSKVTAVTPLKSKKYHFQNLDYQFVRAKPEIMVGFTETTLDDQKARVAEVEKALLDFLHFRKDSYTVDLVLEKLKEAKDEIDSKKLIAYAKLYPVTVQRRLGFLLDVTGIDSNELYSRIKETPGFAKLTKISTKFNSKWRLYYEDRFAE
jgi:predicted transcriptional regulator of viral defense system